MSDGENQSPKREFAVAKTLKQHFATLKVAIDACYPYLKQMLLLEGDVLLHLVTLGVISKSEKDLIEAKESYEQRAFEFVNSYALHKLADPAYWKLFLSGLSDYGQEHVAAYIEQQYLAKLSSSSK